MNMPAGMNGSKHFLCVYMAFNSDIASFCHTHFIFLDCQGPVVPQAPYQMDREGTPAPLLGAE